MLMLVYVSKTDAERSLFQVTYELKGIPGSTDLDYLVRLVEREPIRYVVIDARHSNAAEVIVNAIGDALKGVPSPPKVIGVCDTKSALGKVIVEELGKDFLTYRFLKRLPALKTDEAFYYLVVFRRKWLVKQGAMEDDLARYFFKADEIKIDDGVLEGSRHRFLAILQKSWDWLSNPNRFEVIKGRAWNISWLFDHYPTAFSLMLTYEPRSIREGTLDFCLDWLRSTAHGVYNQRYHKDLISFCARQRRREGPKFALLDFDFEGASFERSKQLNFMSELALWLDAKGIKDHVEYVCSTPSDGLHLVVRLNEQSSRLIFKDRTNFVNKAKELSLKTGYEVELEVKTGQVLTHVPGFNDKVRDFTSIFLNC